MYQIKDFFDYVEKDAGNEEKIKQVVSFYLEMWNKYEKLRPYLQYAWGQIGENLIKENKISFYI